MNFLVRIVTALSAMFACLKVGLQSTGARLRPQTHTQNHTHTRAGNRGRSEAKIRVFIYRARVSKWCSQMGLSGLGFLG